MEYLVREEDNSPGTGPSIPNPKIARAGTLTIAGAKNVTALALMMQVLNGRDLRNTLIDLGQLFFLPFGGFWGVGGALRTGWLLLWVEDEKIRG